MSIALLVLPIIGIIVISTKEGYESKDWVKHKIEIKKISIWITTASFLISVIMYLQYNESSNNYNFVYFTEGTGLDYNLFLGLDGTSIYFILLTGLIIPISILSNWKSIWEKVKPYLIIIQLLSTLLTSIFLVLDGFLFYVFFESILPPLFILIGIYGSLNKIRASYYLFLYTLLGSLFMLLSILTMCSTVGFVDYNAIYKTNILYYSQIILFIGIFIAFAVKTPTIFLNIWLLKAHVESPLCGSIILAAIVLKLSLYGIFRIILPILPKATVLMTSGIFGIGVLTIAIASISTIRTVDIKELIAYSSVCHAAVYLIGAFSNIIMGIEGSILLGIAHGFVSSGLFICAGGVLYDRSGTRLINYYRGMAQIMPVFSILFFMLCLGNCGAPLSVNFIGEALSLYGTFERHQLLGALASTSIIFSAAYTIYLYNRVCFGGKYSRHFKVNIPDVNRRETYILITLVLMMIVFGIYPTPILNGMHFTIPGLLYNSV